MKKKILGLILALLLGLPLVAISASSYVESNASKVGNYLWEIQFDITADTDGSISSFGLSTANKNRVRGMYLIQVDAFPTPNGTAPDAADVFIWDENHVMYLGSEDNGTTAYNGLNLIHPSIPKSTLPNLYITGTGTHVNYFFPIRGQIYVGIDNHATNGANITLILLFTE